MFFIAPNLVVKCATCRFSKTNCKHIHHLKEVCANPDLELSDLLQQYGKLLLNVLPSPVMKQTTYHSCLSYLPIPFDLPVNLAAVLRLPDNERFKISNEVAELLPTSSSEVCSICGHASWSEPFLKQDGMIVTRNQLIPAKGML